MSHKEVAKESLSALLDNEADDLELRRILKSCASDAELAQTWERYNLVHSVLHHEAIPVKADLSQRISEQLQSEAPLVVAASSSGWQQHLAKMAVAASVAVAFFFAVQTNLDDNPAPAMAQQSGEQQEITPSNGQLAPILVAESADFQVDPAAQQRLVEYLESMTFDESEPVRTEHIQDSSLFHLVNDLQAKP